MASRGRREAPRRSGHQRSECVRCDCVAMAAGNERAGMPSAVPTVCDQCPLARRREAWPSATRACRARRKLHRRQSPWIREGPAIVGLMARSRPTAQSRQESGGNPRPRCAPSVRDFPPPPSAENWHGPRAIAAHFARAPAACVRERRQAPGWQIAGLPGRRMPNRAATSGFKVGQWHHPATPPIRPPSACPGCWAANKPAAGTARSPSFHPAKRRKCGRRGLGRFGQGLWPGTPSQSSSPPAIGGETGPRAAASPSYVPAGHASELPQHRPHGPGNRGVYGAAQLVTRT